MFKKLCCYFVALANIITLSSCGISKKSKNNESDDLQYSLEEIQEEYNNALKEINDLKQSNKELEQSLEKSESEKLTLNAKNKELEAANEELNAKINEFYYDQIEQSDQDKISNALEQAEERSKAVQGSENAYLQLYNTYGYVSDEFCSMTGDKYVWVALTGDANEKKGLFNLQTLHEDVPCSIFDSIGDEFENYDTGVYRWITISSDTNEKIGLFDVKNAKFVIPCKAYKNIEYKDNGLYQCTNFDDSVEVIQLEFIEESYKADNLFVYDMNLDNLASSDNFYGRSFFITFKNEACPDNYMFKAAYNQDKVLHSHLVGGSIRYLYGRPAYYGSKIFKGTKATDVMMNFNSKGEVTKVVLLDANTVDNTAYGSIITEQYIDNLIRYSGREVSPESVMTLNAYLKLNGFEDLTKNEYKTSDLYSIMDYIEQIHSKKNSR